MILHSPTLKDSPVLDLITQDVCFTWEVLYMENLEGFISYVRIPTCEVKLGYVKPEYRRQGIFRQLWNELKSKVGDVPIYMSIPINNIVMATVLYKLNCHAINTVYKHVN